MLRHSRLTFVSLLLLLALIVPTSVVQAQSKPQAPAIDLSVAPSANLAVPDEVAQVVKLRESLTADQVSKIQAISESHKAELQEINSALLSLEGATSTQDKKQFLPLVNAAGDAQSQADAAKAASAPKAMSAEKAGQLRQITQRLLAVQAKVDAEVKAVLTSSQSEAYAKQSAKLQSAGQAVAAKLQALSAATNSPEGTDSTTDCFYGAAYSAYANYYAWYGYYYAYYDYYTYGTSYGYYSYLYGYYAYYYYTVPALLYSGGAYYDAAYGFGYDSNGWSDTATSDLSSAYYYSYYSYLYGYYDYGNTGRSYAYYAYYYGYYANYWSYYGYYSEYYC